MGTYQEVAEKFGITAEQVKELKWAMADTWGTICYDWLALFESEREAIKAHGSEAAMVSEATIDADRIKMYGNTDLTWFYDMPAGMSRLKLGEAAWIAQKPSTGRHSQRYISWSSV